MKLKVLGISSGGGVMLYALKEYLIANIEGRGVYHSKNNHHWSLNFGGIPFHKSWQEALSCDYRADVIIGHPDCGSGSILRLSRNKSYSSIENNDSYCLFKLGIAKYRPKVFIMETLEKIVSDYGMESLKKDFKGYRLKIKRLSMSALGNSQINRKRALIIGISKREPKLRGLFKIPTEHRPKNISQLYKRNGFIPKENLPEGIYYYPKDHIITMYGGKKLSYGAIQEGWLGDFSEKTRWPVVDRKYSNAPGVYRNLAHSFPAVVRKTNRQFNPQGLDMSVREVSIIQGLPNEFKIPIRPESITYDINKWRVILAKTPPYELSEWILGQLILYNRLKRKKKNQKEIKRGSLNI